MKRKTDNFSKFYTKKNNAAIKESIRQEKKAAKRERKEAIERHFEEKRKARAQQGQQPQRPARPAPGGKFAPDAKPGKFTPQPAGTVNNSPGAKPGPNERVPAQHSGDQIPLNKYVAHSGVCSRRDAAELIKQGKVSVNGKPVTEPGTKVFPSDTVKVNGKKITISRNFVYILLNKPKDYITTTDDPQGRKTVLDLIRQATPERVFPVGRLDRNTSGVLLLTNDGDLAQKLAHPSHEIKKIYHVVLDKALTKGDFDKIIGGEIVLEDGPAIVDVLAYAEPKDKTQIGLEIHSGRNRIVRRIFEHLGYDVRGLDRVMYAGLTKKNVQRGKWRFLNEKEIRILKYLNSSFKGSLAKRPDGPAGAGSPAAKGTAGAAGSPASKSAANAGAPGARASANAGAPGARAANAGADAKRVAAATNAAPKTKGRKPFVAPADAAAKAGFNKRPAITATAQHETGKAPKAPATKFIATPTHPGTTRAPKRATPGAATNKRPFATRRPEAPAGRAPKRPGANAAAGAANAGEGKRPKAPAGARPKPARNIPPRGEKKAKPARSRKPYNPKSPRPESD